MRRLCLLAALGVSCANPSTLDDRVRVEGVQPPPPFAVGLRVTPLIPGQPVTFTVTSPVPSSTVWVVYGAPGLACLPVMAGACADISPGSLGIVTPIVTNASGQGSATLTVPAAMPLGFHARLQAIVPGVGASIPWDRIAVPSCPGGEGCNLMPNGTVRDWATPYGSIAAVLPFAWSSDDRSGDPSSGSLEMTVTSIGSRTSAWQCVPVTPGQVLSFSGWATLQGPPSGNFTFGEYIFYANSNCTGSLVAFDETAWSTLTDTWVEHVFPSFTVPAGASAVKVGIGAGYSSGAGAPEAHADDYLLQAL